MERVLINAAAVSTSTCVACDTPSSDERCAHCGVAARAGPYRISRVLSRSQHGAMYLAEDEHGAKVALKELVFSLVPSTQELDAFSREAELLKTLAHPRIPKFLKSFPVGSGVSTRLYLAQQYLTGVSLTQRLATEHFDEISVLGLARQALEVLGYLHGRSPVVVHRDVKPDNFILGGDGVLCLVDFGAARSVKAAGTHRATLVGTFGYMAPEQLGGTVDARSDLYGLGATLVHLLTRRPPESMLGPGMSLDFQKHVNVSSRTERFLARLVATRPDERFSSAEEALGFLDGRVAEVATKSALGPRAAFFTATALALIAGGITFVLLAGPAPEQWHTPIVAPMRGILSPTVPREQVKLPETPPAPGEGTFDWIQAKWNFSKPGHWVLDESGRGHHALLPTTGFSNNFFGLEWDGTVGLTTADSADFAPTGPFTIEASFAPSKEPLTKPVTLISRGDPSGKFAWAVQLVEEKGLRAVSFSIADEAGRISKIESPVTTDDLSLYVSFDPKSGEQMISASGRTLAQTVTAIRPAQQLPEGSKLQLITGFRGVVTSIELMRGLMKSTGNGSYSGERLGEN